jgi:HAD superfamily hydrolase (TIGR01549 family)
MIRVILFDFGQTLVDSADGFRTAEKDAQRLIYEDFKPMPWEDFVTAYRRLRKEFQDRSNFSRQAIWRALYKTHGMPADLQRLEDWETRYWDTVKAQSSLFPETKSVLAGLCKRYRLGLITNTQGQKRTGTHRLSEFGELEGFFDGIIVAGEDGIPPKPDPRPFRMCLEQIKATAAEAVFVGDDWRIDIGGASAVGIQPIWLQHHSVRRNWPDVQTTVPIISSLDQLLELDRLLAEAG